MRRTRANKQSKTRADADRIVCAHVCTWNFLFLSRSSREKKNNFFSFFLLLARQGPRLTVTTHHFQLFGGHCCFISGKEKAYTTMPYWSCCCWIICVAVRQPRWENHCRNDRTQMRQNDRFFHRVTTVNFSAAEITYVWWVITLVPIAERLLFFFFFFRRDAFITAGEKVEWCEDPHTGSRAGIDVILTSDRYYPTFLSL